MNREAGFSLVETAVATVVLAVGVLGVVASGAVAARLADAGTRRQRAAELAAAAVARLAAEPCRAGEGSSAAGGITLAWQVTTLPARREVRVMVTFPDGPRTRALRFDAILLCESELP